MNGGPFSARRSVRIILPLGLNTCLAIMEVLHQGLGDDKYRPCPLLRRMVAAGLLGKKIGRGFYNYG